MSIPTVHVKFRNGALAGVVLLNRVDYDPELHEICDPEVAQSQADRFLAVIKGAGYSDEAAKNIFEEYYDKYVATPEQFESMLQEYEQDQEAKRKADREALDEDAAKVVVPVSEAEVIVVPPADPAAITEVVATPADVVPAPKGKLKVGQSSSRG